MVPFKRSVARGFDDGSAETFPLRTDVDMDALPVLAMAYTKSERCRHAR